MTSRAAGVVQVTWPTEHGSDSLLVVCTGCAAQRWWQLADVLLPPCRSSAAVEGRRAGGAGGWFG